MKMQTSDFRQVAISALIALVMLVVVLAATSGAARIVLSLLTFALAAAAVFVPSRDKEPAPKTDNPTLGAAMKAAGEGHLDHRMPAEAPGADAFNAMLDGLTASLEPLKKVERMSAISQMANIMGHEIRNPLAGITNATYLVKLELTKAGLMNPKLQKRIEIIENEVKAANRIINDMLDFSRTRPPVLVSQDLNELVRAAIDEIKPPETVKVDLQLEDLPRLMLDVEEMKQVVRNLVNNGVESMRENGGTLTVATRREYEGEPGRGNVLLEVTDAGVGIPPENCEKVFEPFFTTKSKGIGLGLAVVRKVVQDRHRGSVTMRSETGKGSSFCVRLPM